MNLSIIIPTYNEAGNLKDLLLELNRVLNFLGLSYEVLIIDGNSTDGTRDIPLKLDMPCRVLIQNKPGYAEALKTGFQNAKGEYFLTLDADMSHDPAFVEALWDKRKEAEVVIASRYVPGGKALMPQSRLLMSRILNAFFSRGLSLPFKDLSSGFRLYKAETVKGIEVTSKNFEILEELLIKCIAGGWRIAEVPMVYRPRKAGRSKAKLIKFGICLLKTFFKMWRLRNSIESADYDDRAYDSRIFLQRYWQRRRVEIIKSFVGSHNKILDIGCGSSRLLGLLPSLVGLDILVSKLRYDRKFGHPLVNGSVWTLPFLDGQFDCVICSEVIEHIPAGDEPFQEMKRVLKPGGTLILGTPDYGPITWRMIEAVYGFVAPGGYAHEHITHYTFDSLKALLIRFGFDVKESAFILNSEMIIRAIKK